MQTCVPLSVSLISALSIDAEAGQTSATFQLNLPVSSVANRESADDPPVGILMPFTHRIRRPEGKLSSRGCRPC